METTIIEELSNIFSGRTHKSMKFLSWGHTAK